LRKRLVQRPSPRRRLRSSRDGGFPADLSVWVELSSALMAETVQRAVLPETRALRHFRSRTSLSRRGRVLRVRIVASDLGALRAAANSFLQFVLVARDAVEAVSKAQASKV